MKLTELEGAVLGCIWRDGPVTSYAVRSLFARSRSSHFSGSAGAIYPLVKRLESGGLVEATSQRLGRRKSRVFTVTPSGKTALRKWLSPPVSGWMAAVEFDPIRARVHFLSVLSPDKRVRFIESAIQSLQDEIEATEAALAELPEDAGNWETWGTRGALGVLRARLAWLCDIERSL